MQVSGNQVLPILQVVTATTNTVTSTTSTSFVSTNLAVTITPKFSTSKILVIASGTYQQLGSDVGYITLARGTTNLAPNSLGFHAGIANNNYNVSMEVYDSPGTTSATTYRARIRTQTATGSSIFPVTVGAGASAAVITAIELAQ